MEVDSIRAIEVNGATSSYSGGSEIASSPDDVCCVQQGETGQKIGKETANMKSKLEMNGKKTSEAATDDVDSIEKETRSDVENQEKDLASPVNNISSEISRTSSPGTSDCDTIEIGKGENALSPELVNLDDSSETQIDALCTSTSPRNGNTAPNLEISSKNSNKITVLPNKSRDPPLYIISEPGMLLSLNGSTVKQSTTPNTAAPSIPVATSSALTLSTRSLFSPPGVGVVIGPRSPGIGIIRAQVVGTPTASNVLTYSHAPALAETLIKLKLPNETDLTIDVPSLVVPYLIISKPKVDLNSYISQLRLDAEALARKAKRKKPRTDEDADWNADADSSSESSDESVRNVDENNLGKKPQVIEMKPPQASVAVRPSFFESSVGKFLNGVGLTLVQELIQHEVHRSEKRKLERGTKTPERERLIMQLSRNLQSYKERNLVYRFPTKHCSLPGCDFQTESVNVMDNHAEVAHVYNGRYHCSYCDYVTVSPPEILQHVYSVHHIYARIERPLPSYACALCTFEDMSKAKYTRHLVKCMKSYKAELNQAPIVDPELPSKRTRLLATVNAITSQYLMQKVLQSQPLLARAPVRASISPRNAWRAPLQYTTRPVTFTPTSSITTVPLTNASNSPLANRQMATAAAAVVAQNLTTRFPNMMTVGPRALSIYQASSSMGSNHCGPTPVALIPNIANQQLSRLVSPSPLPRLPTNRPRLAAIPIRQATPNVAHSSITCEICDAYIRDLDQLRIHMQGIHKVRIHPRMIHSRPPLNCQKCQRRYFTDQGLERHLLGSHGLVTTQMQDNANNGKDSGRCSLCGKVFMWKLLFHMSKDHNLMLKPAHLSYKCTVCSTTFTMYRRFEAHVYEAHGTVARTVLNGSKPTKGAVVATAPTKSTVTVHESACTKCSFIFPAGTTDTSIRLHWEAKHELKRVRVRIKRLAASLAKSLPPNNDTVDVSDDEIEVIEEKATKSSAPRKRTFKSLGHRRSGHTLKSSSSDEVVLVSDESDSSESPAVKISKLTAAHVQDVDCTSDIEVQDE